MSRMAQIPHYGILQFFDACDFKDRPLTRQLGRWYRSLAYQMAADLPECDETAEALRQLYAAYQATTAAAVATERPRTNTIPDRSYIALRSCAQTSPTRPVDHSTHTGTSAGAADLATYRAQCAQERAEAADAAPGDFVEDDFT